MDWNEKLVISQNIVIRPNGEDVFEIKNLADTVNSTDVDSNAFKVLLFFATPHNLREAFDHFDGELEITEEEFGGAMDEIISNEVLIPADRDQDEPEDAPTGPEDETGRMLTDLVDRAADLKTEQEIHTLVEQGQLEIGRRSYGWHWCKYYLHGINPSRIEIGNFCSLGKDTAFVAGDDHPDDWVSTYFSSRPELGPNENEVPARDIIIGSDVRIATQAMILGGVQIGHGAIVTARSVVTQDVPPYAIFGGNPAQLIRYRFAPDIIEQLLQIQWWNWPFSQIQQALPLLNGPDIKEFLKTYATT